jgi:hypothetical protein
MSLDIMTAFENDPPELDFVLPGYLTGTVGALVAPGATGKSFFALEAAMSIACSVAGGDLLGLQPPRSGRVVYLAGEEPAPCANKTNSRHWRPFKCKCSNFHCPESFHRANHGQSAQHHERDTHAASN